jgi:hypothetical protein
MLDSHSGSNSSVSPPASASLAQSLAGLAGEEESTDTDVSAQEYRQSGQAENYQICAINLNQHFILLCFSVLDGEICNWNFHLLNKTSPFNLGNQDP